MRQRHLSPRVHHLVWYIFNSHSLESWSLPSSLRSLTIVSNPAIGLGESVLCQVAHDAPELEALDITTAIVDPLPFNCLKSATLAGSRDLRDPANISHRPSFASVTDLRITLHSDLAKVWQQPSFPVFPALEKLHILGPPTSAGSFVTHVGSTRLRQVEVRFTHENDDNILSDCQVFLAALFGKHGQSLCTIINGGCSLESESTFNQFLEEFSSSLRLHVGRSSIEIVKVTVHSRLRGSPNDRHWARRFWWWSQSLTTVVEFINHTWTEKKAFQTVGSI